MIYQLEWDNLKVNFRNNQVFEKIKQRKLFNRSLQIDKFLISTLFFISSFKSPDVEGLISLDIEIPFHLPQIILFISFYSNIIVAGIILITIFPSIIYNKHEKFKGTLAGNTYFIFHFIMILTELFNRNDIEKFVLNIFLLLGIYLYFNFILNKINFFIILKSIFTGGLAFLLLSLVLHYTGYANLIYKDRFFGLASHPNFMGMIASIISVLSLYYIILFRFKFKYYFLYLLLSFFVVYISDSRAALLATSIGFTFLFIVSIKDKQLRYIIGMISFFLISGLFLVLNPNDYLGVRGNNRAETWSILYNEFIKMPFFGKGRHSVDATTNSYFYAVVAAGISGAIFLYLTLYNKVKFAIRILNFEHSKIYSILFTIILITSLIEGFLLENIGFIIFFFWFLISTKFSNLLLNNDRNFTASYTPLQGRLL